MPTLLTACVVFPGDDRDKKEKIKISRRTDRDPSGGLQEDACAHCRYAAHLRISVFFFQRHERATRAGRQAGNELQGETRHITLAQSQRLGNPAQSSPPFASLPAPVCSSPLPADTAQLGGVVQRVTTASVFECIFGGGKDRGWCLDMPWPAGSFRVPQVAVALRRYSGGQRRPASSFRLRIECHSCIWTAGCCSSI